MHQSSLQEELLGYIGALRYIASGYVDDELTPEAFLAATFGIQEDMDRVKRKIEEAQRAVK